MRISTYQLVASNTKGLAGLGEAPNSKETTYLLNQGKRMLRQLQPFGVTCYMTGNNLLQKMSNFQKVLSREDVLIFVHGQYTINVLCVNGFKAQRIKSKALKFNLNLVRI